MDGKYTLAYPDFHDNVFDVTGRYTAKITWNSTHDWANFWADSFTVP